MELTEEVALDPAMLAIAATGNEGESQALSLARSARGPAPVACSANGEHWRRGRRDASRESLFVFRCLKESMTLMQLQAERIGLLCREIGEEVPDQGLAMQEALEVGLGALDK
jgi:hypothetical protein